MYCSENLLFCRYAVEEIAYESLGNMEREATVLYLDFAKWVTEIELPLLRLFLVYAVVHKLAHTIKTSGFHVYQLCSQVDGQPNLDNNKVAERRHNLQRQIKALCPIDRIRIEFKTIKEKIRTCMCGPIHVVSGKTYLLPLLHSYLRRKVKYKGDIAMLKVHLARYCRTDIDPGLCEAVLKSSIN